MPFFFCSSSATLRTWNAIQKWIRMSFLSRTAKMSWASVRGCSVCFACYTPFFSSIKQNTDSLCAPWFSAARLAWSKQRVGLERQREAATAVQFSVNTNNAWKWSSSPDMLESAALTISSSGQRVVVVLTVYWPQEGLPLSSVRLVEQWFSTTSGSWTIFEENMRWTDRFAILTPHESN